MRGAFAALAREIRELDASRPRLVSFGRVVGGALAALAVLVAWRRGWSLDGTVLGLATAGVLLAAVGSAIPAALKPLYRVWMALAIVLGHVMTRVLLTGVFLLVVTPVGLALRLLGKDPLERRPDPDATSYWKERDPPGPPERLEEYF